MSKHTMSAADVEAFASQKMREYGLTERGWVFAWINTKRYMGRCDYRKKRIEISKQFLGVAPDYEMRDTVLHEIAHALTPGHHHNKTWKRACKLVGAKPIAVCRDDSFDLEPAWVAVVDSKVVYRWHRKPRASTIKALKNGDKWVKGHKGKPVKVMPYADFKSKH